MHGFGTDKLEPDMRQRIGQGLAYVRDTAQCVSNKFPGFHPVQLWSAVKGSVRDGTGYWGDRLLRNGRSAHGPRTTDSGPRLTSASDLRLRLEETSRSLSDCIADKEPVFLEIGESLRDFSSRSRELSGRAESLTRTVSGEDMRQAMQELERSQQELRGLWDEEEELNHRLWEALQELIEETRALRSDMEEFSPRIKQLHMLSLYTRIESARMGSQGSGFLNLAGQVEDLAQTTQSHVADIDKRTNQTLEIVRSAKTRMNTTGTERTQGMLQGIEEACKEFVTVQERGREMSDRLDERTSSIASGVQEVVSSLQFHDITRQQVEHVTQVLSEVASMLEEDASGREEVLGWLVDVCSLQERQLESAQQEFSRAMSRIRENLAHIAERIRSLETDISSLSQESGSGGTSALQSIRERVDALMEPMREALASWSEVKKDMDTTAGEVQGMEGCVDQVEAISEEIKIISLNASIQAAHTGEQGRSMGVMAEEVRTLSSEVGGLTQRVGDRLKRVVEHSESLRSEADRASGLSQRQERIIGELEQQVQTLQGKDEEMASGMDWLHRESADLASAIEATDAGADLERQVESELESAQQALHAVREASREQASVVDTDQTSRSQRLQEILQRYTMESERMVHMAFAGQESEQEETSGAEEAEAETETAQDEDELGDNVELF